MILCPDCNNEILPYLKDGEFKQVIGDKFVTYNLHFCLHCKTVFHQERDSRNFKNLKEEEKKKNGSNENAKRNSRTNSGRIKKRISIGKQHGKSSSSKTSTNKDSS